MATPRPSSDSSCPAYYSRDDSLVHTSRDQNSNRLDILIKASSPNVPKKFRIQFKANIGQRNGLSTTSASFSSTNSLSSGDDFENFFNTNTNVEQVHTNPNPLPYSNPEMPCVASNSCMLSASETNPEVVPLPKIEHSRVSASASDNSSYSSVPSSSTSYVNSSKKQNHQVIPEITAIPTSFSHANSKQRGTFLSADNVPRQHASAFHLDLQQSKTSAKPPSVERGVKRKLSPSLNNSDYLSTPSSSSNSVEKEQSTSINSKRNRVHGSSSFVEINIDDEDDDDDVQIIMPETSCSSASVSRESSESEDSSSLSLLEHYKLILRNQKSSETTQNSSSAIHNPLSPRELEQVLNGLWSDANDITSTNLTLPSSSSIIPIHEVLKDGNSFESKQSPPIVEQVPSKIPALDSNPPNSELQVSKAKQEIEKTKEDFKKLIEDELICNICTEVLIKPVTLGCSHTFCKFCISEWKEKKRQCPMCRAFIYTETPCLFLDNFISKAVEQLDPTSVEKRLEIIKCREEEQMSSEGPAECRKGQNMWCPADEPGTSGINTYRRTTHSMTSREVD